MVSVDAIEAEFVRRVVKASWIFVVTAGATIVHGRICGDSADGMAFASLVGDANKVADAVAGCLQGDESES